MNTVSVTLKLESPLLLTGVGNGEENSSRSLSYIPGSALRGALVARYLKTHDQDTDPNFERLFFSGAVRFLHAYPLDQNKKRMTPIPASWRVKKGEEHMEEINITDWALKPNPERNKSISKPYLGNSEAGSYGFKPDEELAIHIVQGPGVVQRGESTVFQYQSLARGQRFKAIIVAGNAGDLDLLKEYLEPDTCLYLGRSRSAGYGKVVIEDVKTDDFDEGLSASSTACTITLLSDAILRDEYGQPTHDLDGYLSRRFGRMIQHTTAFVRPTETGGFNRKWKLPLPQMPAIGMGSVFVYPPKALTEAEITDLTLSGIGERRVDGFGQVTVNQSMKEPPVLKKYKSPKPEPPKPGESPALSDSSKKLAGVMAERILRQKLELNLVKVSNSYSLAESSHISNHQLARLRVLLRKAIDSGQKFDAKHFFEKELRQTAADQWQRARLHPGETVNTVRLKNWVEERINKNDGLSLLDMPTEIIIAGEKASIDDTFRREYTLRLVEAVIDHVMKSNKEA